MLHPAPSALNASELPSMLATLHSYEAMFGPYHLQTLALTVQIARVLWSAGEAETAQRLSERSAKYLARGSGQANSLRLTALATLRDLLREQNETEKAIAVQREIVELTASLGENTAHEKALLAEMFLRMSGVELLH